MSETRNHHYISQFYLKGFSKNDEKKAKLAVYDKEQKKYFQSSPRNIASKRDFNRISTEGKENYIEEHQSKMEAKISTAFKNIIESKKYPSDEDLSYILTFIALVSLRNPKIRAAFDKLYIDIAGKFNDITMASEDIYIDQCLKSGINKEDIIPYEKQKEFIEDKNRYDISINQEIHVQVEHRNIDYLSELLHKRYWYLIISGENIDEFITSDYPVSLISLVKLPKMYGIGFGLEKTEVAFPISKYLALIGVFEEYDSVNKTIPATKKLVETINLRTYNVANKQVYSTKKIIFNYTKE